MIRQHNSKMFIQENTEIHIWSCMKSSAGTSKLFIKVYWRFRTGKGLKKATITCSLKLHGCLSILQNDLHHATDRRELQVHREVYNLMSPHTWYPMLFFILLNMSTRLRCKGSISVLANLPWMARPCSSNWILKKIRLNYSQWSISIRFFFIHIYHVS